MTRNAWLVSLLLLATPRLAAAKEYYFPILPVNVAFSADDASPFCASSVLHERLRQIFLTFDQPDSQVPVEFTLRCESYDEGRVRFALNDPDGKTVDEFRAKVVYDHPESFDASAFLAARRLATGKKTLRAALESYRATLRWSVARNGSEDFAAGRWESAASRLYRALESDAKPDVFYFGLYASHAKLGHAAQARWYLMMFCKQTGQSPKKLQARQLAFLRGMPAHDPAQPLPVPPDLSEFKRLRDERKWSLALIELKNVVEQAPWAVEGYDALAKTYAALGWTPLADVWSERAKLARKVAGDRGLQEDMLDALQGP